MCGFVILIDNHYYMWNIFTFFIVYVLYNIEERRDKLSIIIRITICKKKSY